MASINKVILIGNLGADPEMRNTQGDPSICNLRIATSRTWKDKDGGKREETEWHSIVLFAHLANSANKYLKKGDSVYIEGRLKTRKWTDKAGNERIGTDVIAEDMKMLGGREAAPTPPVAAPPRKPVAGAGSHGFEDMDDDIPF